MRLLNNLFKKSKSNNEITFKVDSVRKFNPTTSTPYSFSINLNGERKRDFRQRMSNLYYTKAHIVVYKKHKESKEVEVYIGLDNNKLLTIENKYIVLKHLILQDVFYRDFDFDDKKLAEEIEKKLKESIQKFFEEKYDEYISLINNEKNGWINEK